MLSCMEYMGELHWVACISMPKRHVWASVEGMCLGASRIGEYTVWTSQPVLFSFSELCFLFPFQVHWFEQVGEYSCHQFKTHSSHSEKEKISTLLQSIVGSITYSNETSQLDSLPYQVQQYWKQHCPLENCHFLDNMTSSHCYLRPCMAAVY
jgi:hypothetical protein